MKFPKERKMYCKKCHKHQKFKVTQYKPGKATLYVQGKRRYDMKQRGYGGQTKPVFRKKKKNNQENLCEEQMLQLPIHCFGKIEACQNFRAY